MRYLLTLILATLVTGCSIITDLDDYTVAEGDGGMIEASSSEAGTGACGKGTEFDSAVDATVQVRAWPVREDRLRLVSLIVVGRPATSEAFEMILSATLFDMQSEQGTFRIRDALVPGAYSAFAIVERNGRPGYQGQAFCQTAGCEPDLAWSPPLCEDGTIQLAPPAQGDNLDIDEQFESLPMDFGGTFEMDFVGFGGAHGGDMFELAIAGGSGRTYAFFHHGSVPPQDPFFIKFPPLLPVGDYHALMYADGAEPGAGNHQFDEGGIDDHSWSLSFSVGPLRRLTYDADSRLETEGERPLFTHGGPFDEVSEQDWPITYE